MLGLSLRNCGYADRCSSQEEGDAGDRGIDEGFLVAGDLVPSRFTGEPGYWDVGGKKTDSSPSRKFLRHLSPSKTITNTPILQRDDQTKVGNSAIHC